MMIDVYFIRHGVKGGETENLSGIERKCDRLVLRIPIDKLLTHRAMNQGQRAVLGRDRWGHEGAENE